MHQYHYDNTTTKIPTESENPNKMNKVTNDILYIGINDYQTDLFESQYPVKNGVTYNSYVILDEKIMVIATTSHDFNDAWMANFAAALDSRKPDYLLIQHMEPDHSATIAEFMNAYPDTTIAASKGALNMIKNYFGTDYPGHNLVIKEGDILSLGRHELSFLAAPMVHWPEVMFAYDSTDKVLFSADAFGRFGAPLDPSLDAVSPEYEAEEWLPEARRYYIGIVGKHGDPVQKVLAKAAGLDIQIICALHGPVLTRDLGKYIDVYMKWATYTPEQKGIAICYTSVYGHTREAAEYLAYTLKELYKGIHHCDRHQAGELEIKLFDLARSDVSEATAAAFQYDRLVLATTTYNNDIFPVMRGFIDHLKYSAFQNRTVGFMENGSWGPKAAGVMKGLLDDCPNLTYCGTTVTIKSALQDDSKAQIAELAKELLQ